MEKISCSIAKDLLPLYIEGILSEETAQVVEMHLQTCESCKKDFEITPYLDIACSSIISGCHHGLSAHQL